MKGLGICSMVSAGHTSTTAVPLHTTNPRLLLSSVILNGSSGSEGGGGIYITSVPKDRVHYYLPCMCSIQPSITRFNSGSYPFNVPVAIMCVYGGGLTNFL